MSDDAAPIENTWPRRELPLLLAALRRSDAGQLVFDLELVREDAGLDPSQLWVAVRALTGAEPPYLELDGLTVTSVTERTRRELGSWPSAHTMVDQLVAALRQAAMEEKDQEKRSRLGAAAVVIGGIAKEILVSVISKQLGGL
jgi:hypothetical protein